MRSNEVRLSVGIPYFRNAGMLRHQFAVWATYPPEVKEQIEIILVDDASPEPAANVDRPAGLPALRIYRLDGVSSRIPRWRQHAGRNRAASEATAPFLLLTDMDHVVPVTTMERVLGSLEGLREDDVLMFPRLDAPDMTPKLKKGIPHPHTNSFVVHKSWFWKVGGYDEDLTGYGTDGFFLPKLKAKHPRMLSDGPIVRYPRDVIPDASTWADRTAEKRREAARALVKRKEARGLGPTTLKVGATLVYDSRVVA